MTLRPLSKREYSVLAHFAVKNLMSPDDFSSVGEYNLSADIALELFRRGLLLSEMRKPYRRNEGLSEAIYLEVGILRPSPKAASIVKHSYVAHLVQVSLIWLVTSGTAIGLAGLFL